MGWKCENECLEATGEVTLSSQNNKKKQKKKKQFGHTSKEYGEAIASWYGFKSELKGMRHICFDVCTCVCLQVCVGAWHHFCSV